MMRHRNLWAGVLLFCIFAGTMVSAGSTQAYLGNTVKLSGYCYTSQTVYLFLTGPNLPSNGVALDNSNRRADQGGFTEVDVDGNNHWEYDWYTGGLPLDAGGYTVWAVNGPHDRSDLSTSEYSTISVTLENPSISVATLTTPSVPGSLDISSDPSNASVLINGSYAGSTPLTVSALGPGTYNVTLSKFDYEKLTVPAKVDAGAITMVNATLKPKTGTLLINTSPVGAQILIDGENAGMSPLTQANLSAGNHTINATLEGYPPVEEQVRVIADQTVTSTIELNKSVPLVPGMTVPLPLPVTFAACIVAGLLFLSFWARNRP